MTNKHIPSLFVVNRASSLFSHSVPNKPVCYVKADRAASQNYWRHKDSHVLTSVHTEVGPPVTLPNSSNINDDKVGYFPLGPHISSKGKKARILNALCSANIISLGQLADDGCITHLDKNNLIVEKHGQVVLTGTRNKTDGLYDVPIYKPSHHPNPKTAITPENRHDILKPFHQPPYIAPARKTSFPNPYHIDTISPTTMQSIINHTTKQDKQVLHKLNEEINVILRKETKSADLADFWSGCLGSPVISTLLKATLNGHFLGFPGLNSTQPVRMYNKKILVFCTGIFLYSPKVQYLTFLCFFLFDENTIANCFLPRTK